MPSGISIYTDSACEIVEQLPPDFLSRQRLGSETTAESNMASTLTQRLLKYAQRPNQMIRLQDTRAVFNDLQQYFLGHEFTLGKDGNDTCRNVSVADDIVQIRNMMNITDEIYVSDKLKGMRAFKVEVIVY